MATGEAHANYGKQRRKHEPRGKSLRSDVLTRLARAEGQLRGIQRMVGEEAYCIDLLQQISAVRRALDKLALLLIRDHLDTCVTDAIVARRGDGTVRELIEALDRFLA
jgi:DNA-binding FrmR family transcriptional regulator